MNPSLHYFPVYIGLFAVEMLALICNCFLDIQYGDFTMEVVLWFLAIVYSLRVGQRQEGVAKAYGNKIRNRFLILGIFLFLVLFLRIWGMPRAGIYFLGVLLIAYNCTMTTVRQMYLGVLTSLVMVIFASSHYRADWTMLFYIIPYMIAVVFTLVAEQVNRKAEDVCQSSLNKQLIGAQSYAIGAACLIILSFGLFLYLITPQVIWPSLVAQWGNPGVSVQQGESGEASATKGGANGNSSGNNGTSSITTSNNGWPTAAEMRNIAGRQGMPTWQRSAIESLANASEEFEKKFGSSMAGFKDLWQAFKEWLQKNLQNVLLMLFILMLLLLVFGFKALIQEAKVTLWLLSRFDYLRLGVLAIHAPGNQGAIQYYKAIERLFNLYDMERSKFHNSQEYLWQISRMRKDMKKQVSELTLLFEDSRYGSQVSEADKITRMCTLYRNIYQAIDI